MAVNAEGVARIKEMTEERIYTPAQIAQVVGCTTQTVRNYQRKFQAAKHVGKSSDELIIEGNKRVAEAEIKGLDTPNDPLANDIQQMEADSSSTNNGPSETPDIPHGSQSNNLGTEQEGGQPKAASNFRIPAGAAYAALGSLVVAGFFVFGSRLKFGKRKGVSENNGNGIQSPNASREAEPTGTDPFAHIPPA